MSNKSRTRLGMRFVDRSAQTLYFAPDPNVVDPKRFNFISNQSKFMR